MSDTTTQDAIDAWVVFMAARMHADATRFLAGDLTAATWQTALMADIKATHIASALAAYGGRDQMTPARWGLVGQIIRQQYDYQRAFTADVLGGRQRRNGRLPARAALYAAAARVTYQNVTRRVQADQGARWERNVLGTDESCRDCVQQTALGWVPLGTLSPIGSRACRSNCKCRMDYGAAHPQHVAEAS